MEEEQMLSIAYKGGYKYQLQEPTSIETNIKPARKIEVDYITLFENGVLLIYKGYAWDGASGIPDTPKTMRGSLGHDALYQLMRMGRLPLSECIKVDQEFRAICLSDGMWRIQAWSYYHGLRLARCKFAKKREAKHVLYAPHATRRTKWSDLK